MKATTANTPRRPGWLRRAICWTFGLVDAREVRLANAKGAEWKRLLDDANNDRRRMRDDLQALTAARDQALRERDQARLERIEACKEAKEWKEVAEATRGALEDALDRARESLDHTGLKCDACEGHGSRVVDTGGGTEDEPCDTCRGYGYARHQDLVKPLRDENARLKRDNFRLRDCITEARDALTFVEESAVHETLY